MGRSRPGLAAAALLAVLIASAFGCGVGPGRQGGPATLTVTSDFGGRGLGGVASHATGPAETAMRQLQRLRKVETAYSGRFVQSINGVAGGVRDGSPFDWFYFVNGIEAPVGAAETVLHPGDAVWWDFRDWKATEHVPAVVGSFPHPFTGLPDGKRPPVRLICSPGSEAPCAMVERRLADVGVPAARGLAGTAGKGSGLRVLVGPLARIGTDPATLLLTRGPASSGVYLRPVGGGTAIELLRPDGSRSLTLRSGTGLIAATVLEQGLPTWFVSGTDDVGVAIAAQSLTPVKLRNRYAAVFTAAGDRRVPEGEG